MTDAALITDNRICPKCARAVRKLTFHCSKCLYKFSPTERAVINTMTDREKKLNRLMLKVLLWGAVICGVLGFLKTQFNLDPEAAADKQAGFHCLSKWDGSSFAVINYVKDHMRDPSSFEHIETKITPRDSEGNHTVFMSFRGRNGFGGMAVETATVKIQNSNCLAVGRD